jgi:hypothetical protein
VSNLQHQEKNQNKSTSTVDKLEQGKKHITNDLEVSSVYIVMTVAQEYMRKSTLEKESGNRLPEFLETLPHWPETAGERSGVRDEDTSRR